MERLLLERQDKVLTQEILMMMAVVIVMVKVVMIFGDAYFSINTYIYMQTSLCVFFSLQ